MQNLKIKVKKHIKNYYSTCRGIESKYAMYETKEAKNLYAPMFIQQKLNEKITKLKNARLDLNDKIEDELLFFIADIRPDQEEINSISYQTKLTNIFNLLNLESELDESYFDFMVEANDFKTLELLKNKYKSKVLTLVFDKVDKEKVIANARVELKILSNYIDNDKKFTMEESILKTLA